MFELDMQTVIFANILINVLGVIVLVQLWHQNIRNYSGFHLWIAGWAVQLSGALLLALRNTVPDWASIVLGNILILVGPLLLYYGLKLFIGKKSNVIIHYVILFLFIGFVIVQSYFTFVENDLAVRTYNACGGMALISLLNMWLLLRQGNPEIRRIITGTVVSFAAIAAISIARIIGMVFLPYTSHDFMQSGMYQTVMVALLAGAGLLLVLNLILMVNRRLYLEAKQTEESFRETSEYLNNLFDYANAPIIVWDAQFRITRFNHAFERLAGQTAEEVIGKELDVLLPRESREISMDYIKSSLNGKRWETVEIPVRHEDGSERTVLWNSASIYATDGKTIIATIAQGQDITVRKQMEQKLKQAAEEWQRTFDSINTMISIQDKDFRLIMVNKAYADFFKKTPQELIGRLCFELVHGTDRCIQNCPHQDTMQNGKPSKVEYFDDKLKLYLEVRTSPIFNSDGTVLGTVHIAENITERKLAEEKMRQNQVTLANINKQLEERHVQNSQMSEMRELLQSCSTIQEIPTIITNAAAKLFPDTDGAVFLLNNSRTDLQSVAKWGEYSDDLDENIFALDACWGLRLGRVHLVEDMKTGPICLHIKQPQPPAYICLPLIARGDTLGLLHLRLKPSVKPEHKHNMMSELKEIAVVFEEYLSLSIANIKLWEKLADQSIRDPLTRLYNRRYMEETFQREIQRAVRKQTKIGIVMADIDHFKKFNDTLGHKAGDELLAKLADFFKLKIRSSDIACRYGGEEFILILPESSPEDTLKRAEKLREEVKNMKVYFNDQLLPSITLSMGISTYPDHGIDFNELIRIADIALYKAKEQGRDRVVGAGSENRAV